MATRKVRAGYAYCGGCRSEVRQSYMGTITDDRTDRTVYRCGDCQWRILLIFGAAAPRAVTKVRATGADRPADLFTPAKNRETWI